MQRERVNLAAICLPNGWALDFVLGYLAEIHCAHCTEQLPFNHTTPGTWLANHNAAWKSTKEDCRVAESLGPVDFYLRSFRAHLKLIRGCTFHKLHAECALKLIGAGQRQSCCGMQRALWHAVAVILFGAFPPYCCFSETFKMSTISVSTVSSLIRDVFSLK